MACEKSIEIPNFLPFSTIIAPPLTHRPPFFPQLNPITFLHSSIAAMKRLDFRRFPSPLYSIITIHTRENRELERGRERWG
ncbi:hypothetical protein HanXRQr2_Chr02g0086491 [Helianthus annuus]|uniref:Uncharacterized protein n=1 Tax=Helianthus annuus TaxID=4232 RepID=A0A251VK14_HELAN|nr:hypothetical protein HanXRQr2_Chr02g0086491 [Helianthus annuus]KAJ0620304.1 hypothetical protein HanHA89_Chr02g0080771 [Helianthus annuus]